MIWKPPVQKQNVAHQRVISRRPAASDTLGRNARQMFIGYDEKAVITGRKIPIAAVQIRGNMEATWMVADADAVGSFRIYASDIFPASGTFHSRGKLLLPIATLLGPQVQPDGECLSDGAHTARGYAKTPSRKKPPLRLDVSIVSVFDQDTKNPVIW